jgi:hypothetical protein
MGMTPTYLLDLNYHFIDWNWAFDELVARPHRFERGAAVNDFLRVMDNRKQVMERSARVFAIDITPLMDIEVLLVTTPPFGQMALRKLATTIFDENGNPDYWVVTYNIDSCENADLLWKALEKRITCELEQLARSKSQPPDSAPSNAG